MIDQRTPWHVNSKPKSQLVFSVNSLDILIYTHHSMGDRKLFNGLDQFNRYIKTITEFIKYHEDDLASYGNFENLGSQSV